MKFWASVEGYQPSYDGITRTRQSVEAFLNAAFAASSLATLSAKLRYVPIVMPEDMRERYPERSRLRKKEKIYDCAPQLNYEIFIRGTFEEQLKEYMKGIASSAPHLAALGATPQQIEEFETIVATAAERILAEETDEARP